jgi:hypothetical protein
MDGAWASLPSWTHSFLNTLEYVFNAGKRDMKVPMGGASREAKRWDGINPTTSPRAATSTQVLPGLYVQNSPGKKKEVGIPKINEGLIRELSDLIKKKSGSNGIVLYSMNTDLRLIMEGYADGVNSIASEMHVGDQKIMSGAPLTSVEHDNSMLYWGIQSKRHPDKLLHTCVHGKSCGDTVSMWAPCVALTLEGNQGPLPMWLTPSQKLEFDENGNQPEPGPCLLCIRRNMQEMCIVYGENYNTHRMSDQRPVVPPFSIKMDVPGGYNSNYCTTPETSHVVTTPFPMSSVELCVRTDETGTMWFVDQGRLVYNNEGESLN